MKRDFIHIDDMDAGEIESLLDLAAEVKERFRRRDAYSPFQGHTLAMVFAKPSARTRISFETGFYRLGGHAIYLATADVDIGKREPVKDVARVISRYNDMIMARLFDHAHILELAQFATVPVINGLTDYNHPCQILADIFTIREHRGHLKDLKVVYVGDGNNIVHSWLRLARRLSMTFVCACPPAYPPDAETVAATVSAGVSDVSVVHDPMAAVRDADILYTDVWASMGKKHELDERKRHFAGFQIDDRMLAAARSDARVMHCLPAMRDLEISDAVMESKASIVFDQAENRMHAQNAIMLRLMGKA